MKYSVKLTLKILFSAFLLFLRFVIILPYSYIIWKFFKKTNTGNDLTKSRQVNDKSFTNNIPLFFYSQVIWWEVWQRPQEFCMRLSKMRPVIFFSPIQIHRAYDSLKKWKRFVFIKNKNTLIVSTPLIFPGEYKSKFIAQINRLLIESEIRLLVHKYKNFIFATNSPFIAALPKKFNPILTVYDVIDDFIAFSWAPSDAKDKEQELFKITDLTFTGTSTLLEKKKQFHKNIHFIKCGVNFEMFNKCTSKEIPEDIKNIKKPILGYIGSISDRLDAELIASLSGSFSNASIILIGPVHGSFGDPPKAKNIFYLGLKNHSELPNYLHNFDVCLMPFRLTEAALAINPVKTLEYLAAGKPVVSTAIPDVIKFYGDVVAVATSKENFIALVDEMLNKDQKERIEKGILMAKNSSWDNMTIEMKSLIEDSLKKKFFI